MTETTKPLEILKRLYTRYFPFITLFSLLSLYGAPVAFPGENIPLILILFYFSQFFCWLLIIFALWYFNPGAFIIRVMVIVSTSLLGALICYIGLALLLNFVPFYFIPSTLSTTIFIIMLMEAVLCSGTIILVERSLIIERKYTEEKTGRLLSEKKLVEDQLNLLQAQIEPHFLFNTMESIYNLFDTDPEKANTMQMYFIQYLRATLIKTRARTTTIEQEMDLIRSYMNIFKISMEDRLEYEIDVDQQAKESHFPSLIIQPIVEYLIKNRLEMDPEGGHISISIKKKENMLNIRITDTVRRLIVDSSMEHILSNIGERLKSLFEDKGKVKLEYCQTKGPVVLIEAPCA